MSEEGWRTFLAAKLSDWVVLHGGATAVYRVASLRDAARFAERIALLPDVAPEVIVTLCATHASVRLTRDVWSLRETDIDLARAVSGIADELRLRADRSLAQEVQVAVAAHVDAIDVGFWRAVLGYAAEAGDNAVDPLGHGSTVWMQRLADGKSLRHAMHIDVSVAREQVQARLDRALAAGGTIVDASHAPAHWTLSDRSGNRVCVCAWPDGSATT